LADQIRSNQIIHASSIFDHITPLSAPSQRYTMRALNHQSPTIVTAGIRKRVASTSRSWEVVTTSSGSLHAMTASTAVACTSVTSICAIVTGCGLFATNRSVATV